MISQEYPFLILLVGANPLPNYLVACALRPRRLALLYTDETREATGRLRAVLSPVLGENTNVVDAHVSDATCATTVRRVLDGVLPTTGALADGDVWLNYTGGTKVMAAHARMAFHDAGGKAAARYASYLDEGGTSHQPRLRFDDGNSKALKDYRDVPLSLETILELHGIKHKPRTPKAPAPTGDDARVILCKVLTDTTLADTLYKERRRLEYKNPDDEKCNKKNKPSEMVGSPFVASSLGLNLSIPRIPSEEPTSNSKSESESWYKQWYQFIGGEWLEEWMGEQIRQLGLSPAPAVTVGVNAKRGTDNADLEIDISVIRGHRSYFISCTTDTTKQLCKSKLFEIAVRSRQLGGDLARAALICLAEEDTVRKLRADIDDLWGASNTTQVFGLSELKSWSGYDGTQPNLHSLEEWLNS